MLPESLTATREVQIFVYVILHQKRLNKKTPPLPSPSGIYQFCRTLFHRLFFFQAQKRTSITQEQAMQYHQNLKSLQITQICIINTNKVMDITRLGDHDTLLTSTCHRPPTLPAGHEIYWTTMTRPFPISELEMKAPLD